MTSADVARAAGVSRTTVSFVLNNTPNQAIPGHTKARVLDAADRLGYIRSASALTLQSGSSRIVLYLMPHLRPSEPVAELLAELTRQLRALGLILLVHQGSAVEHAEADALWAAVDPALVLTAALPDPEGLAAIRRVGVPVLEAEITEQPLTAQGFQSRIGYTQAQHLIDTGHRMLAFAGTANPLEARFGDPRLEGVRSACKDSGLQPPLVQYLEGTTQQAQAALDNWTGGPTPCTAVCAHNDDIALLVLAAARARHLQVPGDLSVIGVDDTEAGRQSQPQLSTIRLHLSTLAAHLTVQIAERLGIDTPTNLREQAEGKGLALVARDSTKPL